MISLAHRLVFLLDHEIFSLGPETELIIYKSDPHILEIFNHPEIDYLLVTIKYLLYSVDLFERLFSVLALIFQGKC